MKFLNYFYIEVHLLVQTADSIEPAGVYYLEHEGIDLHFTVPDKNKAHQFTTYQEAWNNLQALYSANKKRLNKVTFCIKAFEGLPEPKR